MLKNNFIKKQLHPSNLFNMSPLQFVRGTFLLLLLIILIGVVTLYLAEFNAYLNTHNISWQQFMLYLLIICFLIFIYSYIWQFQRPLPSPDPSPLPENNWPFQLIFSLIIIILLLIIIAYYTNAERKIMAAVQRRVGPNIVGFWGLLQAFSDALKLISKEMILPLKSNTRIFIVCPLIILVLCFTAWSIIPNLTGANILLYTSNNIFNILNFIKQLSVMDFANCDGDDTSIAKTATDNATNPWPRRICYAVIVILVGGSLYYFYSTYNKSPSAGSGSNINLDPDVLQGAQAIASKVLEINQKKQSAPTYEIVEHLGIESKIFSEMPPQYFISRELERLPLDEGIIVLSNINGTFRMLSARDLVAEPLANMTKQIDLLSSVLSDPIEGISNEQITNGLTHLHIDLDNFCLKNNIYTSQDCVTKIDCYLKDVIEIFNLNIFFMDGLTYIATTFFLLIISIMLIRNRFLVKSNAIHEHYWRLDFISEI